MKQLLIWDVDGTLMDCRGVGRLALNLAFESLYGIKDGFAHINFSGTIDRQILDAAKEMHNLDFFEESSFLKHYSLYLRDEIKKNSAIKMLPGIQKLLEDLRQETGLYHMIATGNAEVGAQVKLEETGLAAFFKQGVYGEQAEDRTALVALAIEKAYRVFGVSFERDNIFVIGDTPLDVKAAHHNKVKAIAVATGRYSVAQLSEYKPDFLFDGLTDGAAFLSSLGR